MSSPGYSIHHRLRDHSRDSLAAIDDPGPKVTSAKAADIPATSGEHTLTALLETAFLAGKAFPRTAILMPFLCTRLSHHVKDK
jgi:hypothetical protein